ncbi:tRNA-binding protein [Kozakia baliensis]|uniref:tRNA-binding protein n=1 Tax=Kozakia baliensis TaxID=153496 RepID=UPI001D055803|nr:tRNA-binding protein [Kozakia baliensis]
MNASLLVIEPDSGQPTFSTASDALDIRVGTVTQARLDAGVTQMWIDFGPQFGIRRTAAKLSKRYKADQLIGSQVCAVVNPRPQVTSFNQVLALGMPDRSGEVVLIRPDQRVPDGGKLF